MDPTVDSYYTQAMIKQLIIKTTASIGCFCCSSVVAWKWSPDVRRALWTCWGAAYWHGLLEWVGSLFAFKDRPVFLMVEHIYLALVKHLPHREASRLRSLSSPSSSRLSTDWNANKCCCLLQQSVGWRLPEASSVRNECETPRDLRITCWVWLLLHIQTLFSKRIWKPGRRTSVWDPFTRAAAVRSALHGGVKLSSWVCIIYQSNKRSITPR